MEDSLAELLEPDVTNSYAYWDSLNRKGPLSPEEALMLAILEDAIRSIERRAPRTAARREALIWVLDQDSEYLFSFVNICAVLRIDADYLRKGLLSLPETQPVKTPRRQVGRVTKISKRRGIDLPRA